MSTTTVPAITDEKAPEDFDDPVELAEHISERFGVPWSHLERLGDLITWLHMGWVEECAENTRARLSDAEQELCYIECLDNPLEKPAEK